ncbi:serine hydrolase [Bradyrhizobium sp. AUGA SZCCT0176]|uniref:serine hydrolase domain-containing protein n=1 Tax=Bradyrhizobium sp. AUGA SZCCT0176 TaxID=2807664 RepID=UPI001BAB333A|nr:serine hydrolase [Bradyrhizobium sp. AUGA SZCCT0176]MBR1226917.1 serine hydrolase [Bradyrhizobium sp. AUGA SZCCT0176]
MPNIRSAVSGSALGMLALAALICGPAAFAQAEAEGVWPTRQWQTSTPEEQGMDSMALANLLDFGKTRSLDSLLLVRHGRIVLDAYYAPYTSDIPHRINSSTKAVVGTLAAIAHKDGLLDSFDHPVLDFFGDRSVADADDRKKAITVQHLLDMTSGIDWKEPLDGRPESVIEMSRQRDWIKFILDRPMSSAPGEAFNYNSGGTHLLSGIITKLTGMSAADYAKAKLFGPLGITVSNWWRDPQGNSTGGYGLALLPRDMAKIGYLYLRNGQWEDKSLLPPGWIDKVSHATVNMNMPRAPDLRYSNLFWALPDKHVYMANGYHCQLIMVLPRLDIVAVTTARDFCPLGRLADLISGAVKSETALPPDTTASNRLADKIREISTEKATETGETPGTAAAVSGRSYKFSANALNVKSISLILTHPSPHYDLELYASDPSQPSRRFIGPIGLDGLYRKADSIVGGVFATKGKWLNGSTFEIERQAVGMDELQKWTLSFDGDRLHLRGRDRAGREVSADREAGG